MKDGYTFGADAALSDDELDEEQESRTIEDLVQSPTVQVGLFLLLALLALVVLLLTWTLISSL